MVVSPDVVDAAAAERGAINRNYGLFDR